MRHSEEVRDKVVGLHAGGKASKDIATELGMSRSTVLKMIRRHRSKAPEPEDSEQKEAEISAPEAEGMVNESEAKSFLSEIGIKSAASLKNDILKPSNPLKGNVKALRIAQALMTAESRPQTRLEPPQIRIVEEDPALLISQIQMNVEHFGPLLGSIVKPDEESFLKSLYSKPEHELSVLLKVIEKARLVGNMTNQLKHVFWMGSSALEVGCPFVGIKAEGLSQSLKSQEVEIGMILKEIALEQAETMSINQRPEMRLAFLVSTTLLSVDAMNRRRAPRAEVKENFKDL